MYSLQNSVALVTGGAQGIGREIVLTLARRGAEVLAADVDLSGLEKVIVNGENEGMKIKAVKLDVTTQSDWDSVLERVGAEYKKLDILVNNAGIMESRPFFETSLEDFRKTMRVNLEGMFIGIKAAYPLLLEGAKSRQTGASVINISSTLGKVAGPRNTAYCTSKAAVIMLTKAIAVELGLAGSNIRVNSVLPGGVETGMIRRAMQSLIDIGALADMDAGDQMVCARAPLGRMGRVDDIAEVVAFLASDASKFMTGSEVTVDGGYTVI